MDKKYIVGEDMICPVRKEHCDDECCTVGSECNLGNFDDLYRTSINSVTYINPECSFYTFPIEKYIHDFEFLVDVETPHYTITKGTVFKGAFYKRDGLKQVEIITHTGGYVRVNFSKLKIKN